MRLWKRIAIAASLSAVTVLITVGPWPAFEENQPIAIDERNREQFDHFHSKTTVEPIAAGWGETDITPPPGVPLAGYSARNPKANQGFIHPVHARALTLQTNSADVTFVSLEILLPLPELVDAIVAKTGLPRSQLYFGATHSHSSPGGYSQNVVQQFALGDFSESYFQQLVERTATAIQQSRNDLKPATLRFMRLTPIESDLVTLAKNEFGNGVSLNAPLFLLSVQDAVSHRNMANLISLNMHPTILGRKNARVSGDYPAALIEKLQQRWQSKVMFMAGAVGGIMTVDANEPLDTVENQLDYIDHYSDILVRWITQSIPHPNSATPRANLSIKDYDQTNIDSMLARVELPSYRYLIGDHWQLSPIVLRVFLHDYQTDLHTVKIGDVFLFGYPADFSAELALTLQNSFDKKGLFYWPTSFNGDYIGYLSSSSVYSIPNYVTRDANFFGKWTGDLFGELSNRFAAQASNPMQLE